MTTATMSPLAESPVLRCAFVAIAICTSSASTQANSGSSLSPDGAFLQLGGGTRTQTIAAGALWKLPWQTTLGEGAVSIHVEGSFGRWWTRDRNEIRTVWVTQLGLTPALRYRGEGGDSPWFAELGIGVNVLAPVFRDGDRQFSTAFNFGDHVALGRLFGTASRQELSVRLQHFSNAGIKHPNPGINFIQLRYAIWF
ncbi:MAG TPA: acyloxyacyl hydrolase [Burkholderiaceae bacterium]